MTAKKKAIDPRTPRRLLGYDEIAWYLNCSVRRAKQLAAEGEFGPKVDVGARVTFDARDIDAYVDRKKAAA
ncbi:helix-turn-helix transcriptional regulator [Nocardioides sp. LHG3406-4]|uniref:helix-turn-helix transcriptional regulator n=1 Tax=Nocardioides sp. LHG3406-4 TaxID=2804575 RepID=UPI003CEE53E8